MKKISVVVLFAASVAAISVMRATRLPVQDGPPSGAAMFYGDLSPYGEWIEFQPDLYAWRPFQVETGWRPYSVGRWVWSDYGWYWISPEPFGWVTYHYGRWYFDNFYGWIWMPDTIWGPAWVEWRYNDDYIGWAPLPPYARFHVTVGIRFTARWSAPVRYWSFITFNDFCSGNTYRNYAPEAYSQRLISTTRSAGRYAFDQNRIVNHGVSRSFIEQRIPNRIVTAQVEDSRQRGAERVTRNGQAERIEIFRPRPEDSEQSRSRIGATRAQTKPSLDLERVDRYRSIPQRGDRSSQNEFTIPQRQSTIPQRQMQQPGRQDQRTDRPDVRRDRPFRIQPSLPTPRIEKTIPARPQDGKQKDRPRGEGRRRF